MHAAGFQFLSHDCAEVVLKLAFSVRFAQSLLSVFDAVQNLVPVFADFVTNAQDFGSYLRDVR
jgi:hypothetical protein